MDMTLIDDGLYVGGALDIKAELIGSRGHFLDFLPDGIDAILNLREEYQDATGNRLPYAYMWLPIPDAAPAPDLKWLALAVRFIENMVIHNKSVLVHCAAGRSRSPFVAVAYLMKKLKLPAAQTIALVASKQQIDPNPAFVQRLLEWEQTLRSPLNE